MVVARRSGVRVVAGFVIAAVVAVAAFLVREPIRAAWRDELIRRAIEPSGRLKPRLFAVSPPRTILASSVAMLTAQRSATATASVLLGDAHNNNTPEDIHRTGVALLLTGNVRAAAEALRTAATREQHAGWWSDLAAAEITVGDETGDPERHLAALEAADTAIALDARLPQAHFNRAMVMERLGFERASIAQWQRALEGEHHPAWSDEVASHITELSEKKTARERWLEAQQQIDAGRIPPNLDRLIHDHPQEARSWGESWFLPLWAKEHLGGRRADHYLTAARAIGRRLALRSGERLLHQVVADIDAAQASGQSRQLETLAHGLAAYFAGRVAFKKGELEVAGREFKKARAAFRAASSPMTGAADLYLAMNDIRMNRTTEARASLVALRARALAAKGHESLTAQAEQYLALLDGLDGRWGDALDAASSAKARFARLAERQNEAEAELTMADILAFLGQPRLAWRHLVRASAAFTTAGTWDRVQVCATAMNYVEMRRQRWSSARALSRIELALGNEPELVAHAHLRAGAAAFADNDLVAADASLRQARASAASTKSEETRDRLLADVIAVEARLVRTSNPGAAVEKLTESIAFQKRVGRAFSLPELYLERGRAELARGASDAALVNFDQGIEMLERQRSRIRDYELRSGLFDDARHLFVEAVEVSLDRGDPAGAFAYLERGRARALRDALGEADLPGQTTVAELQRSLGDGMLVVSYALLDDRVAIFTIDRSRVDARFSDVHADVLMRHVQDFVRALERKSDIGDLSGKIYDALLRPVHDLLPQATTLVIIPDAALAHVPFPALFDREMNAYLVDSHESLLAPSAAVFVACARRLQTIDASPRPTIALFANPILPSDVGLPPLPAAESEAPAVARLYEQPFVVRRAEATAARFRSEAARYEIVQFSGHTELDGAEPWKSALLFDERLTARSIASMKFPQTRLTILGACSTLAPNRERVEGTSPIASSFLIAGVPAVVGSLWDIEDREAAAVLVRLHEHLVRRVPAATALRAVQRQLLRTPGHDHPGAWAAFTVLGMDRGSR